MSVMCYLFKKTILNYYIHLILTHYTLILFLHSIRSIVILLILDTQNLFIQEKMKKIHLEVLIV